MARHSTMGIRTSPSVGVRPSTLLVGQLLLVIGALMAIPGPVAADCDTALYAVDQPRDAQGTTFVGRFLSREPTADGLYAETWVVEHPYAGEPGKRFSYTSTNCHRFRGLVPGDRYLLSTAHPERPTGADTVVWRISGKGLRLVGIDAPVFEYGDQWHVRTLREALALVAPGTLPPTDGTSAFDAQPTGSHPGQDWLIWVIGAVATLVSISRLARRSRSPATSPSLDQARVYPASGTR